MSATTTNAPATPDQKPHPDAVTAVVLGAAGLLTLGLTSPFAWWKANQADRGIDADPVYGGRGLAQIARVIGIVGTVFLATWLLLGLTTDLLPIDVAQMLRTGLNQAFGPDAIVYALAAIGLNVHFGYTGLLNFGQAGFMAVGAYGLAVSVVMIGIPFWGGIAIGLVASVALAIVLGFPTLRLRADYLAIATIASAEILRLIFGSVELSDQLGGSNGINGYTSTFQRLNPFDSGIDLGIVSFSSRNLWAITVGWTLVAIAVVIVALLMRSPWGRVLRSIREDEEAVRSLGKNVFAYKMQALILGGVFGGVAGIFLALKQASVVPTNYSTNLTFFCYTALLIGGAARVLGPVVGAMIFWFILSAMGSLLGQATSGADPLIPPILMDNTQASLFRFVIVGLALMLLMIFRPQGIFGDRRELAIDGR